MSCNGTGYLSYTEPRHCPGCHDCQPEPLDAPSCDACGGTGQRGRFDERDCEACGGKGHVLDCCSSCGAETDELVETGEDNGGSAWLECPDCRALCDGPDDHEGTLSLEPRGRAAAWPRDAQLSADRATGGKGPWGAPRTGGHRQEQDQ